jgi:hypothetical protein
MATTSTKTKFDEKDIKKAIDALDYDAGKMAWDGHVSLIVQRANKDKSLAFLERYLTKMKQYAKPKPAEQDAPTKKEE